MAVSPESSQIQEWKREFGRIFSVPVRGTDYVFREIKLTEYDMVQSYRKTEGSALAEELLVEVALLFPTEVQWDSVPAGVVTGLAEEILEYSGFASPNAVRGMLEEHRERMGTARALMKSFVLAAMPAYKEEELDGLTFNQLCAKVALAEQIIEVNQAAFGVENKLTLDLIDPEEEALREQQEIHKHAASKKPGQAGAVDPIAHKLHQALG